MDEEWFKGSLDYWEVCLEGQLMNSSTTYHSTNAESGGHRQRNARWLCHPAHAGH